MQRSGMSLLELVLALFVSLIIAAVAVPRVLGMREKSRGSAADAVFVGLDGEIANALDATAAEIAYVHEDSSLANVGIPGAVQPVVALVPDPSGRLVLYDGRARLAVHDVDGLLSAAEAVAKRAGGWVESSGAGRVVLRVPAGRFDELFGEMLALGKVLSRAVRAEDVTDSYRDLELRIRTARATRDRLTELLARESADLRKIELLAEIRRLTGTLAELAAERDRLAEEARFSRVTLEVVPRVPAGDARAAGDLAAFAWIHHLAPAASAVAVAGERLEMPVPEGMLAFGGAGPWRAEGADGALLRATAFANEPRGSSAFWREAIRLRLGEAYEKTEDLRAGDFELLRMVDGSEAGHRYLVGVAVDDDELRLVEIYFPSPASEERHRDAVLAALSAGPA